MLGDLALAFDEVRESYEAFDAALLAGGRPAITPRVFPPTTLDDAARERARHALTATDVAQPAVGAASVGMLRLLENLGVTPVAVAGHSYGELVALHAAGCLPTESLATLSEARGRLMREAAGPSPGAMAAIVADAARVARLIEPGDGVVVANLNGPRQTVVSGPRDGVVRVVERGRAQGLRAVDLPVACAFHSGAVAAASAPLANIAQSLISASPDRPVFANLDAIPHPSDPSAIADRLGAHVASPVRFAETVEAMHAAGSRVFVEVGPGAVLTPMVGAILGDRPHLAVSCDAPGRPGIPALLQALARLCAAGVALNPARLTEGRGARRVDIDRLPGGDGSPEPPPSAWLVNGSRARPLDGPEPRRLGQAIDPRPAAERNGHHAPRSNGTPHPSPAKPMSEPTPEAAARPRTASITPRVRAGPVAQWPRGPPDPGRRVLIDAGAGRVMEAFQQTMRAFLATQEATMLAYLGRRGGREAAAESPPTLPSPARGEGFRSDDTPESNGSVTPPGATGGLPTGAGSALDSRITPARPTNGHVVSGNGVHDEPVPTRVGKPPVAPGGPVSEVEKPGPPAQASIAERLVAIVRERTGYPAEMLKLDLDLEADLGIDSIKRVEILGTLRDSIDGFDGASDSSVMDGLARSRTLGEIVERVESVLGRVRISPPQDARKPLPPWGGVGRGQAPSQASPPPFPPPSRERGRLRIIPCGGWSSRPSRLRCPTTGRA